MVSISNDPSSPIGDRILEAAAYCVTAYGVERVTLAEIARRARVSRPTVYRRWPDIRSVLAALLTARIVGALDAVPTRGVGREAVVERMVAVADHLRDDEVVMSVLNRAPELTMVYTTERLGTSQQILIDTLAADIKLAQDEGSVRPGEPRQLAAMCLLIARSTIQSGQIVAAILDARALDVELAHCLDGYLKP
ncbi:MULTISPECIES: TetR/AcrR family transcriptional regulator [Actinomycetes]|jgi:AcrR family transcriptional regulator|uniref:TetR/AcrR family transcriptional regulator n=1 Tax=Actinomycetes TaxID=1760 RepID=UPI002CDC7C64|nr:MULTISPECIES: TetR/AcrR family transcriptional regulator [Actinomycetes]HTH86299.1 TetR/AcrR family transcriptional regulator [Mycobacterium sp.]HXR70833.1 TetR/AcrR family transcriptional regulator [Actinocrinis sp.]